MKSDARGSIVLFIPVLDKIAAVDLSGLWFWLSPSRRAFMRTKAAPGLRTLKHRLRHAGSPTAVRMVSTLLDANAEFLAHALSKAGPLGAYAELATPKSVEACLCSLLIYSINLFARDELARDDGELLTLIAATLGADRLHLMVRRDALRKTPRSEEWMLYTWLLKDLGAPKADFDNQVEAGFGYQYVGYISQYRDLIERQLRSESRPELVEGTGASSSKQEIR